MKKILFFFLCFMFIGIVNAQECIITKGTGKDIGDEVKCGTEEFYVIGYTETTTTLLAKYNLLVGDKISYIEAEGETPVWEDNLHNWNIAIQNYCDNLALTKGYNNTYMTYPMADASTYTLTGCRVYERIVTDHIRQDSRAEGTVLVNGKSKLPLYGIVYMVPEWGYEAVHDGIIKNNIYDSNGDLILEGSSFEGYINGYKEELEDQGIDVNEVSFLKLSRFLEVVEAIHGEPLNIELEYDNHDLDLHNTPEYYIGKMDVRDYVPEEYSWLYDRTYWFGSGFETDYQGNYVGTDQHAPTDSHYNDYYISNEGFVCALGRGECGYFVYPIGNGIRPVLTVASEDVIFAIETKTDGNGTIKAEKVKAKGGEVIKFTVTPNEGYVLGEVKVTDASGNVVIFTDYTFTMPNANVLIEATFVAKNPKTADIAIVTMAIIAAIAAGVVIYEHHSFKKLAK